VVRAVVLDVLARAAEEARLALAEEPDPFRALARYLHRALDLRISAVMPALLDRIPPDDEEIASVWTRTWGCSNSWSTGRTPPGRSARTRRSPTSGCCWCGWRGPSPARSHATSTTGWRTGTWSCCSTGCGPVAPSQPPPCPSRH
jgi:hypothetical protein